jgi:hypothetical protein
MDNVPQELSRLTEQSEFTTIHNTCGSSFGAELKRFLSATNDEVRIATAGRAALQILQTIGIADFGVFREAVLRRELFGNIAYKGQRDHSSHPAFAG